MEPAPLASRVVEVIAHHAGSAKPHRYGSGCIVVGSTVLSAAHVVSGADSVEVRDTNKVVHGARLDSLLVGDSDGPRPDLALLELIDAPYDFPPMPLAVVDRGSVDAEPVERCRTIGYPWFAERPDPTTVRDTADVYGHIPVLSKLVTGLLSLVVSQAPEKLPGEHTALGESQWSGMSGAPVVAGGFLLGVVTEHAAREGSSTITVTPLSSIDPDTDHPAWRTGMADPRGWWKRLGVSDSTRLAQLPPRRRRPEPAYRATVREIHARTGQLVGREQELAEISGFASSTETYRWFTGPAWAGKTALLAAAVISALPEDVVVVSYFLSRREADADSNRFLAAVIPQLADLVGEELPLANLHEFRRIWTRAADTVASNDRHLLLVVDGLDEDLQPGGSPSVAAVLPAIVGTRAHVLVSSRPHPELPSDVPVGHPLRAIAPVELDAFEGATELAELARQEIDALKRRDDSGLAADVLATLTAAAGPVTVEDLATLIADSAPASPNQVRAVRRVVTQDAARSLQPVGPAASRRYQFAHFSLLEYARDDADLGDVAYRQRIHRWAEQWRDRGWPLATDSTEGTPRYLLDAYTTTLADDPAPEISTRRLVDLVADFGWLDAAVQYMGIDFALAALRTAAQSASGDSRASSMLRLLELQARNLRAPRPVHQPGYAATALSFEAFRRGVADVGRLAGDRLERCGPPQLVPEWTTESTSARLVTVLGYHSRRVEAIAVGDDHVVSVGGDGVARAWNLRRLDEPPSELVVSVYALLAVAVSAVGEVVCAGVDGDVTLWDLRRRHDPVRVLGTFEAGVAALSIGASGRLICGARDGTLHVWDSVTPGSASRRIGRNPGPVFTVAEVDEHSFASGGRDGSVRLWAFEGSGQVGRRLGGHQGAVQGVAVTGDGSVVSGGDDCVVRLWPLDPGALGRELRRGQRCIEALAVARNGALVCADDGGSVDFCDATVAGKTVRVLGRHDGAVRTVAFADGLVVSGGNDGAVCLWDPAAPDDARQASLRHGLIRAVALGPGRRILTGEGGSMGAVHVWEDLDSHEPASSILDAPHRSPAALAFGPDGTAVSGSGEYDAVLAAWDLASGTSRVLGSHAGGVRLLAFDPHGQVISGGADGWVRQWDPTVRSDKFLLTGVPLTQHKGVVFALAVAGDGRVASGGSDKTVRLWSPEAPDEQGRLLGEHHGPVRAVGFGPDGRVLSIGRDGLVRAWDDAHRTPPGTTCGVPRFRCGRPRSRRTGGLSSSAGTDRSASGIRVCRQARCGSCSATTLSCRSWPRRRTGASRR